MAHRKNSHLRETRVCGTVLVVDDDAAFRAYVASLLDEAGYHVVEATSSEEALRLARAERPSLALLDVHLPHVSGYEICRALREEFGQEIGVIFISGTRTESFDRSAGLLVGADDYIVKPFAPEEFVARVRALLRRIGPDRADVRRRPPLTPRELEVLTLLAEGLNQEQIAQRLFISPKTVGTHIEHILSKLGARSRAQAVAFAYSEDLIESSSRPS